MYNLFSDIIANQGQKVRAKKIFIPIVAIGLTAHLSAEDLNVSGDQTISKSYDNVNVTANSTITLQGYGGVKNLEIANDVTQVVLATQSGETTFYGNINNENVTIRSIGTSTNKIKFSGESYFFKNIELTQGNGAFTITSGAKNTSFLEKISILEKQNLGISINSNLSANTLIFKQGYENQGSTSAFLYFYAQDITIQAGGEGIVTKSGKTTFQIQEDNRSIKIQNLNGSMGTIKTTGGETYFEISILSLNQTKKEIVANILADGGSNTLRLWMKTEATMKGNIEKRGLGKNNLIIKNLSSFTFQGSQTHFNEMTLDNLLDSSSIIFDSAYNPISASIENIANTIVPSNQSKITNNNIDIVLNGNSNPITLTLGQWEDKNFRSISTSGKNNVLNIASQNTPYKTLKIGDYGQQNGMVGEGLNFVISAESNVGKNQTQYADKIIIHSANNLENGVNKETLHYIGVLFRDDENVEYKEKGNNNVLIASVANDSKVKFQKEQTSISGFEIAKVSYVTAPTDENGNYQENGNYTSYFIGSKQNLGILQAEQEITATAFTLNYDLYMANLNSLNKRMGELRENTHSQGVWARVFNGALSNEFGLGSKSNYTTIQTGYDYAFGFEGANNYLGVALSYALSTSTSQNAFDENGQRRGIDGIYSNAVEVALYNSYVSDSGWYNDSIAKFSYIMSKFDINNLNDNTSTSNDTSNFAFTLSDEVGCVFKLGEAKEWSITPQIEATFGYFSQSDFKQTLANSNVYLDSMAENVLTLRTRVGSAFAYDFKNFTQKDSFNASLYVGAFYEYDYVSGGEIKMSTQRETQTNKYSNLSSDGRVVMNVGTNMSIQDHTRLYFDFEKSFAGKITTDYQVNFGVRYSFGESNGYTPMIEFEAPLKIESEEKSKEEQEDKEKIEDKAQESKEIEEITDKTQKDNKIKEEKKEQKETENKENSNPQDK